MPNQHINHVINTRINQSTLNYFNIIPVLEIPSHLLICGSSLSGLEMYLYLRFSYSFHSMMSNTEFLCYGSRRYWLRLAHSTAARDYRFFIHQPFRLRWPYTYNCFSLKLQMNSPSLSKCSQSNNESEYKKGLSSCLAKTLHTVHSQKPMPPATPAPLLPRANARVPGCQGGRVPAPHAHLQHVLLAVDDDGGDLLVHEEQDGDEQGGQRRCQVHPPGVAPERRHEPAT